MKTIKKLAWKNSKCNECGRRIYVNKEEDNVVYESYPEFTTPEKAWKLCEKCNKRIFKEEK